MSFHPIRVLTIHWLVLIAAALSGAAGCSSDSEPVTPSDAGAAGSAASGSDDGSSAEMGTTSDDSSAAETGGICSSDGGGAVFPEGGVEAGADTHCIGDDGGQIVIDPVSCATSSTNDGGVADETYDTRYGNEADDDDCKYHVKWSSTCIAKNEDVYFNVSLVKKKDGTPASGANPDSPEVFLSDIHPAPNTKVTAPESPAGVYEIGPVKFDASGDWTVRFHFFEFCVDGEDSKHAHVAFHVLVP